MSRKNHKMIDGRLLQTNKKYSQLKMKQKEKIAEWMFQATRDYYMKKCTFPSDKHLEEVVDSVYEKIEDAEIWIPYGEVFKHYKSKRSDINKRVRKSLNEKEESRIEKVCFMNMCMIQDHKGNVLALDKVNDSYTGTTFPGGHVEANEIFQKSMIREVWEETGLTVEAPKLGGLYHWHKSGVHYVITLYKADKFTGELKSSEEGRVYWIPLEELKTKELATGMEHVLRILESEKVDECYMHLEAVVRTVIRMNPLYCIIENFRHIVLLGESIFTSSMEINMLIYSSVFSVVALVISVIVFKKNQDRFILYI